MGKQIKPQNPSKNEKKITLESLYALLDKGERDAQKRAKERDREWEKSREEWDREKKESDEKFDREWGKIKELQDETWRIVREVSSQLGGINNSNGDVAEEYFQSAFEKNPTLNGQKYDTVSFNMYTKNKKIGLEGEYDIVLMNGESVAIIEIKYHLKMKDYFENSKMKDKFKKILNKTETFKTLYPLYKNHKFYLGIAGLSFDKNIESRIIKEGIAVIKQVGNKMVINSDNLKEF